MALDYGFTHYTAAYLFGKDSDGHVWTIAEHAERKWLAERHAAAILALLARYGLSIGRLETFVAGGDVFATDKDGKSVADEYARHGIELARAQVDRVQGAAEIMRRLGDAEAGIAATVSICEPCARLIECLPAMEHDPHRPEDVLKTDADENGLGGDDCYDAWRYGLMAVRPDDNRVWVY
jgi:hypothetical protein